MTSFKKNNNPIKNGGNKSAPHPLITDLRSQNLIRPNTIGLGLDTDTQGALYTADDEVSQLLYTLGTPRKGDL